MRIRKEVWKRERFRQRIGSEALLRIFKEIHAHDNGIQGYLTFSVDDQVLGTYQIFSKDDKRMPVMGARTTSRSLTNSRSLHAQHAKGSKS